ncbi:hypothetical protein EBR03_09825 [bacterium]|nr:hypothetical protein [bacterium]
MDSGALPQIINFTAMVAFLGLFGKKPLSVFLNARSEEIKKQIDEAEKESKEVSGVFEQAKDNFSHKAEHAKKLRQDAETFLQRYKEKTMAAAQVESARIVKDGQLFEAGELNKRKELLQREIGEKSVALAEKYLSDQLEGKDKEKLIAEYIQLVGHGKP